MSRRRTRSGSRKAGSRVRRPDPELSALFEKAASAYRTGRLDTAEAACGGLLARDAGYPDALHLLALVRHHKGDFVEAERLIRRAIAARPHQAAFHADLAEVCFARGRIDAALKACDRARSLEPERPGLDALRGDLLDRAGHASAAAAEYLALAGRAGDGQQRARWLVRAGICHEQAGDAAAAASAYRNAVRSDPACAEAWHALVELDAAGGEDLETIRDLAGRRVRDPESHAALHFALGRHHERGGDPDGAFRAYRRGNDLVARQRPFDAAELTRYTDRIIEAFDTARLADVAAAEAAGPVFIVGMPRSGTTLLERMLASHPQVTAGGEREELRWIAKRVAIHSATGEGFPEGIRHLDAEGITALASDYRQRAGHVPGEESRFTDKLPGNYLRVGLISLLLPEARIIHCRRHPLDTCVSCYTTFFARGQAFTFGLERLAHAFREYRRLMEHWRRVLPGRFAEVDYERLIASPESELRRLLAFCGLDWHSGCLAFHAGDAVVASASRWQVRRPLYRTSAGRWRAFRDHLGPLLDLLADSGDGGESRP